MNETSTPSWDIVGSSVSSLLTYSSRAKRFSHNPDELVEAYAEQFLRNHKSKATQGETKMPDLKKVSLNPDAKEGVKLNKDESFCESEASSMESIQRDSWGGKLDFIMSTVSYAVGLGNIWRFPYLCYRNGGAVFLIPYITFMIICGMPLFFLEVSYGQFASLSPITVWYLSPLFKGIGYGMVLISSVVCIYYNVIITWTIYYLFKSFTTELPWSTCDNEWNTDNCALRSRSNESFVNETLLNVTGTYSYDTTTAAYSNTTAMSAINGTIAAVVKRSTPSEEFWERHVLELSDGIDNMGGIRWELFGCLALSWVLVFLCLIRGARSSGKVMYFTATFPYLVLICLLLRGATLPGAVEGVKFYVIPQFEKLLTLKVWGEAAMQIFYSVGAAWGALITMASYNNFNNNCYRDAKLIPIINCGTSVFAGFVIFSIIGFMAHETGSTIAEVVRQGPGLVFVVYPEAVSKFPVAPMWAILFFSMLLSIGIGSQVGMFQTVTSAFIDEFHFLKNKKVLLTACLCIIEFLLGIPCITRGGIYYLQIMDWYSSTFSLMILSFTELVVISWIYGVNRFYKDIELMIGYKPCIWWRILWAYVTPSTIVFVLLFSIIMHSPVTYGDYEYPNWAIGVGWLYALVSMVPLPILAAIKLFNTPGSFMQRIKKSVKHAPEWGPALDKNRELYYQSLREEGKLPPSDDGASEQLNQVNGVSHPEKVDISIV